MAKKVKKFILCINMFMAKPKLTETAETSQRHSRLLGRQSNAHRKRRKSRVPRGIHWTTSLHNYTKRIILSQSPALLPSYLNQHENFRSELHNKA